MHIKLVEKLKQLLNSKWIVNNLELIKKQHKSYCSTEIFDRSLKVCKLKTIDRSDHWKHSATTTKANLRSTEVKKSTTEVVIEDRGAHWKISETMTEAKVWSTEVEIRSAEVC